MIPVLIKALTFILIIAIGYGLKHRGFFKQSDFRLLSRIVLNITLPCAVITNFNGISPSQSLLTLVVLGVLCNLVLIVLGRFTVRNEEGSERAFAMINTSGYNIGCFAMPYIQSFLGPSGVIATCLFDAGNAIMCTGGTYAMASSELKTTEKITINSFLKKLFSSIPTDTYIVMLILSMFNIHLPKVVTSFTETVGAANGFLAMLMIGISLELKFDKAQSKNMLQTLFLRYGVSVLIAIAFYFFLPLPLEVRQVLVLIAFAPLSSSCTIFTEKCSGDVSLSGVINSASILISITLMTVLLLFTGIS